MTTRGTLESPTLPVRPSVLTASQDRGLGTGEGEPGHPHSHGSAGTGRLLADRWFPSLPTPWGRSSGAGLQFAHKRLLGAPTGHQALL